MNGGATPGKLRLPEPAAVGSDARWSPSEVAIRPLEILARGALGALAGALVVGCLAGCLAGVGLWPHETGHEALSLLGAAAGVAAALRLRGVAAPDVTFGSARFSDARRAADALRAEGGLLLGRRPAGAGDLPGSRRADPAEGLLRYGGEGHLLTIAPTRSGKGVGAVIPNLLLLPRGVLCIDPKGENARISRRARAQFGPAHVLDPFGISGAPASAFNPLAGWDPEDPDLPDRAAALAEALVHDPPGQGGDAHWNEEAKALIAGVILHVATARRETRRSLIRVREHLAAAPAAFTDLLEAMQANPAAGGLVARAADRHLSKNDREGPSVRSAAQRHTHFLDGPRMAASLERSDFTFRDLRERSATVYLVLPPNRLATHARWLRVLVGEALFALSGSEALGTDRPVLFLLDEFAALGRLEPVLQAVGLMAGYGVQIWLFLQDLHQLRSLYGKSAGTFLSNAAVLQVFNVSDLETAEYVSRALGPATARYATSGASAPVAPRPFQGARSRSEHLARRDLLTPDEVMRLPRDRQILLRPGERPLLCSKIRYFDDAAFQGAFDP